uniref:NADH dehydrogenase [ubiquinone] iron-sulfur protein 6, mitochondrial n=1 Tax=Syphacia muris TaxID=451379 RepID=A0A0N5AAK7_9BILA
MNKLLRGIFYNALRTSSFKAESRCPQPQEVSVTNAVFDKVTHTGQAWDKSDYRLQRFDFAEKMVNPNIAQKMIAEVPPVASEERIVFCDGDHGALGHPRVYINLDKPGNHACGYCGKRFYNPHITKDEDRNINHYNC